MRSHLTKLCVLALAAAFLTVGPIWASGSSYPAASVAPAEDPMLVTKSTKVRILEVAADGAVKIQNPKTEETSWIRLTEQTEVRAKDKKAFDGRKKLELSDLKAGQLLRVTHRPHDGAVLKIKVLRQT